MEPLTTDLWKTPVGTTDETPYLTAYIPDSKRSDGAVVIFPGGGYSHRATHEGKGYAEFLATKGIPSFVCDYRVSPHRFPLPLLDARRAIRTVRYQAEEFGINKAKIAVMGSSAGGHLAALTATYFDAIEGELTDEIDCESCIPDAQILCYPVIKLISKKAGAHIGSTKNLLGERALELAESLTPDLIVKDNTPKAFIWHTCTDKGVPFVNSLDYAKALADHDIPVELHVFPCGGHGIGLGKGKTDADTLYISEWGNLLIRWLNRYGY